MTDVLLFQTLDDGDIDITGGITQLTEGLETAVYLSLFGGNERDDGLPDNPFGWWGNAEVDDEDERQISRLQNLMDSLPATSGNLKRLNDAAKTDLAWLPTNFEVQVSASIPGLNRVRMTIGINDLTFEFTEEWARR